MSESTEVRHSDEILIVGGGPTGLILCYELLRRKIPVRIIEKRSGPSHTARAFTIHARTMEMFDHMSISYRLKEICLECPGNIFNFPGIPPEECPKNDYRGLPTRYPFYYKISQNSFEQVLRNHLFAVHGVIAEYSTPLVGLSSPEEAEADGGRVTATIQLPDGKMEKVSYPWVIGCDGVRSFVRQAAGIDFPGRQINSMAMMDVHLSNVTFDTEWLHYFFTKNLFMNISRMPGKELYRVYMSEPTGELVNREDRQQVFQEVADQLGIGFKVGEVEWSTAWEVRNNIATSYRAGRLLICGDASHVHSPAGGQGMNGCMQDAFNLGWKLAAVYKGQASPDILDTYEKERKPIGEQISAGAAATHKIVMGFGIEPAERLPLTQVPNWEEQTVSLVSGLAHNYIKTVTPLLPSMYRDNLLPGPKPGSRAPDVLLTVSPQRHVYDIYRRPQFTLLVIPDFSPERKSAQIAQAVQVRDAIVKLFPTQVCVFLISDHREEEFGFDNQSLDEVGELKGRYGIEKDGQGPGRLVLTRPDLYIALTCELPRWEGILEYLAGWYFEAK
ncbi:pentachlorophenol monooxygenase [Xylaria arbuscula]|nr:pentachlorophenol monooxygenase [Xylaria arbuscula]